MVMVTSPVTSTIAFASSIVSTEIRFYLAAAGAAPACNLRASAMRRVGVLMNIGADER
jgi:hypothetical protein